MSGGQGEERGGGSQTASLRYVQGRPSNIRLGAVVSGNASW